MGIFVEAVIRAPMDALWTHTQAPDMHQRWDLRFSRIEYLPKSTDHEPQWFRYSTRIGFGRSVAGVGESVADRSLPDGSRASSLRFGSDDRLSLIKTGGGYWRYSPMADGIRFVTWYDYRTRFGRVGALIDRVALRPLLGWATAWSFDRLRLWLERGIPPETSARAAAVHTIARFGLAATFAWHGTVPKLLGPHPQELTMLGRVGVPDMAIGFTIVALGIAEIAFAVCLMTFWHRRWPMILTVIGMVVTTAGVAVTSPEYLGAAFDPVATNLGVACLALIDLAVLPDVPDAGSCRRRPPEPLR